MEGEPVEGEPVVAELPPPLAVEGGPEAGWGDGAADDRPGRALATAAVSTPPAISDPTAR